MTLALSYSEEIALRCPALSARELRCLQMAADGESRRFVANAEGIHEGTVKNLWHTAAIKLGADNARHAIAQALRRGLIK